MTDRLESALSAQEWADALDDDMREGLAYEVTYLWGGSRPAATIAIANAALPNDDPRKITLGRVQMLRHAAAAIRHTLPDNVSSDQLDVFADALASYLPPEHP